ncbi:MAG: flavin reductase family protein [Anaerolineaceae bacterium]|nr:flavin reductase family protein [Anaerolineaceae bacterium]
MTIRGKIIRHRVLPATTCLMPLPVALVTCRSKAGQDNIITIAWTGVVCSQPPMVSIAVRPSRFSYELLEENGDFVINLPSAGSVLHADLCGCISGRDKDKFAETNWTPIVASVVNAAIIRECPLALECRTRQRISLGSHELFIGEVLAVQAHEELLDANGRLQIEDVEPLAFCPNTRGAGQYFALKGCIGHYGFSAEHHKRV